MLKPHMPIEFDHFGRLVVHHNTPNRVGLPILHANHVVVGELHSNSASWWSISILVVWIGIGAMLMIVEFLSDVVFMYDDLKYHDFTCTIYCIDTIRDINMVEGL